METQPSFYDLNPATDTGFLQDPPSLLSLIPTWQPDDASAANSHSTSSSVDRITEFYCSGFGICNDHLAASNSHETEQFQQKLSWKTEGSVVDHALAEMNHTSRTTDWTITVGNQVNGQEIEEPLAMQESME